MPPLRMVIDTRPLLSSAASSSAMSAPVISGRIVAIDHRAMPAPATLPGRLVGLVAAPIRASRNGSPPADTDAGPGENPGDWSTPSW